MPNPADQQQGGIHVIALSIVNQYGESLEIPRSAMEVSLFESIYSKFVTGEIAIDDGLNLTKNFRFTGQENVRIIFRQQEGNGQSCAPEDSIDKVFRVYKVSNEERVKDSKKTYIIKICDPRMFRARRQRISQTLRGSYTDMLVGLFTDEHFGLNIPKQDIDLWEQTVPDNNQFISPNWTIARLADHFVARASKGEDTHTKNGMFLYQTLNGGFRFASIDTLTQQEFPLEFSFKPRSDTNTAKLDMNAPNGANTQILAYSKPQLFDTLQGTIGGAYASSMKAYDPLRKLEQDIVFDLEESFKKGDHVSGHPLVMTGEM